MRTTGVVTMVFVFNAGCAASGDEPVEPVEPSPAQCKQLDATFRDFRASHPDMEEQAARMGDDRGLVQAMLGDDGKPVYAPSGATRTVSGKASFDQWYRDVDGVNHRVEQTLDLTEPRPGVSSLDDGEFFPLDGKAFNDVVFPGDIVEGQPYGHNFFFTTEIHGTFRYRGGDVFTFSGDDDIFIFVNKRLALDLGGVHHEEFATIDFDAMASQLEIEVGGTYQLDIFHADRHSQKSIFRIETTLDCLVVL